jgi:hypothetical protein
VVGRRKEGRGTVFRYVFGDRQQAGGEERQTKTRGGNSAKKSKKKRICPTIFKIKSRMAAHISASQLTCPAKAHMNRLFYVSVIKGTSYIGMVGYISRHTVIYLACLAKVMYLVGHMSVCHDIYPTIPINVVPI